MAGRRSGSEARETRESILRAAADMGSVEGLRAITIGRLAAVLGMSKAGVVGQFGSKEALQLATIELAAEMFRDAVWVPVRDVQPGLPRLLAISRSWAAYLANPPFAGGCLLILASMEFGAQDGRVRDGLAVTRARWRSKLLDDIRRAVADGDFRPDTDAEQVVFVLEALAAGTKGAQLQGDPDVLRRCGAAMRAALCNESNSAGFETRSCRVADVRDIRLRSPDQ